jgi:hypothetical protein
MRLIKLSFVFLIGLFIILFSVSLALASFEVGNVSDGLTEVYGVGKPISGWINLSVVSEASDSILSVFDSSVSLMDLLEDNSVEPFCSPLDCSVSYSTVGGVKSSEDFSIGFAKKKVIGVKIVGNIGGINKLNFDVSTDAGASCVSPLQIDVLNDGAVEWKHLNTTDSYCNSENPFGCFDSTTVKNISVTEVNLCEKIVVPPTNAVKIGAILSAIGNDSVANFQLTLNGEACSESVVVTESGEMSCIMPLEEVLEVFTEMVVCINAEENFADKYSIRYDNYENSTCGFKESEDVGNFFDFEIFAKPLKYSGIDSDFRFNDSLMGEGFGDGMAEEIFNYISERYSNCNDGCIIPISFISGINQELTISGLELSYDIVGDLNPDSVSDFYELNSSAPFVSFGFEKLELEGMNFLTPLSLGKKTFSLKLNDEEILEKEIIVRKIPEINNVFPKNPSSLVPVTFIASLENNTANLSYSWDFGDNSSVQNSNNEFMKHTYSQLGSYDLKLTIKGSFGESSKTFKINVIAPADAINKTLINYKANLKNLKKQIDALPLMIRTQMEKEIDLDDLGKIVDKKDEKFKDALTDEEFVDLMKELLLIKVPKEIVEGFVMVEGEFFQIPDEIKLENFEALDVGVVEGQDSDYFNAMNNWIIENLDATIESKNYIFNYDDAPSESLFSYIKIKLKPLSDLDEVYVVINGNPAKIKFSDDFKDKDIEESARAIIFDELIADETTVIEFIHPGAITIDNLPVYISPDFSELELSVSVGACNNDGKCGSGENTKNCKNDCKPWKFVIFLLFVVFFIGFIAYIILQEWYKRKYESHLFKNKNQLFNLINFISVSEGSGTSKDEIFNNLKNQGWKNEQLVYAWKKYKGKRTGMWEIPIFSVFEKRKLKKELAKRKGRVGGRGVPINPQQKKGKKKLFGRKNKSVGRRVGSGVGNVGVGGRGSGRGGKRF